MSFGKLLVVVCECLLDYVTVELEWGLPNMYTSLQLCGAQTGVAKRAIAFDSLCRSRMGVPKRPSTICVERNGD